MRDQERVKMSRRSATDTQPDLNKRVRFDATASNATSKQAASATPKALADAFVLAHVESLQPQLASILQKLGEQHISHLHKLHNKAKQIERMERDLDFIPQSARFEFTFHMSQAAETWPEFISLKADTESKLLDFRKYLKTQIIAAISPNTCSSLPY